jgi:hypothetical protein
MSIWSMQYQEGIIRGEYYAKMSRWQKLLCKLKIHSWERPDPRIATMVEGKKKWHINTWSSTIMIRCKRCGKFKHVDNPCKTKEVI